MDEEAIPMRPVRLVSFLVVGTLSCLAWWTNNTVLGGEVSDQIKSEILDWSRSLSSIHVSIVSSDAYSERQNTREFAIDGIKKFESLRHDSLSIDSDPDGLLRYFDGKAFNVYFPFSRRYEIAQRLVNDENLDKIRSNFFCEALGWWPAQDPSKRSTAVSPWYLDEIVANRELRVTFANDLEVHLEIPSVLKIEYDRGTRVIKKRTYWWGTPAKENGSFTFILGDYGLFAGVLLPQRIERYSSNPQLHTTHRLKYLSVNQPLDHFYSIEVLPGTIIVDRDTSRISQVPGGFDWLNGDLLSQIEHAVTDVPRSNNPIWLSIGVFASSIVCGIVFAAFFFGACFNVHK